MQMLGGFSLREEPRNEQLTYKISNECVKIAVCKSNEESLHSAWFFIYSDTRYSLLRMKSFPFYVFVLFSEVKTFP